ncbi:adenylyl cyclase X E isoform X2 [Teleopsis dalmanni]|uniref:adenylyl cyclase X E isoform X2 n=1 Tax=Teleopsis dalmanni TaxID=139649 RepID=UPI0018CE4A76|nr:adenylyl cyclase X E isoform X2 [Teleopsis dalmanni]
MDAILESSTEYIKHSNDGTNTPLVNEKKWESDFLRKKCRNLELEQFYKLYLQRLNVSYLSLFLIIETFVVIVHSILLLATVRNLSDVYVDICIYIGSSVALWIILAINFYKDFQRHSWILYVTSWLAITVMMAADLSIPIYHAVSSHDILRPTYACYVLFAVYIFMPVPENLHSFILGIAVTISYLVTYTFITYRTEPTTNRNAGTMAIISDAIFLLCVNLLGLYYRMNQEIAIRTTFLDRRQCVEENLLLRYARDQEKSLLLSIIPAQIANKIEQDVKVRIEYLKAQHRRKSIEPGAASSNTHIVKRWRQLDTEKLFIEPHNDVTILYADVVNYTHLTTTLDVKTLVETLHDLFVKFDLASEEFHVLRIKFLGDCYYCVAGVPIPNEYHAKCCVELGLRMITDIRDVRAKRKLDIDMRIGVHSGNILSGVIGACKWQYDIWSKDVDIANRLESTGKAGRVHVSEQTLKLLDGEYLFEEGTPEARNDEVLRKYRIHTFLIKPPKVTFYDRSIGVKRQIEKKSTAKQDTTANFMHNTIMQYNQIRNQAKLEMSRELDKMPIGRIQMSQLFGRSKRLTQDEMEEQSFRSNITSLGLFFKDWRWEFLYLNEPDVMLKYSILFGFITFLAIVAMQAVNEPQSTLFWILVGIDVFVLTFFLVVSWYKKLWIMFISDSEQSQPKSTFSIIFYNLSDRVQRSLVARIVIYLTIVVMHCTCTSLQLLDCDRFEVMNEEIDIQLLHNGQHAHFCFNAWAVSESVILTVIMVFLFTRVPFVMKLFSGVLIIALYSVVVEFEFEFIYEKSPPTNVGLYAEYSHILILVITLIIYHLIDRQMEFISKVDYNWKRQLQKRQDDAKFTNETIKILINNILPSHVADIYMRKMMKNELYYEEYENVAVMFATIRNYDTEKVGLRVLNEIICDFDEMLNSYRGPLKIEKIKVAGWTYMAACGLDLERSDHIGSNASYRSSSLLPNGRRSHHTRTNSEAIVINQDPEPEMSFGSLDSRSFEHYEGHNIKSRKISSPQQNNVVYVMVQFALDLMKAMHSFNTENLQYEDGGGKDRGMLRIGISHGEIMAGVVGSYKPHYDIWGNAVNMASRMDSTGIPGCVQVTEETAEILKTFDINCDYRGLTYVKGRGKIPTYIVGITDKLQFIKISNTQEAEK